MTPQERQVRVVGVVEHPHNLRHKEVVGFQNVLLLDKRDGRGTGWLADTAAPVLWQDVLRLNGVGLTAASRAVLADPPPTTRFSRDTTRPPTPGCSTTIAAGVVLAVLETVLLAGPAFAVGLRRRRRELALIAAQGGSGAHLRAIVLADGLVLGGAATLLGAVLGTGGALVAVPILARWTGGSARPRCPGSRCSAPPPWACSAR